MSVEELETWSNRNYRVGIAYFRDWGCGDDECGCEQMFISRFMPPDPEWPLRHQWKLLWEGEFHTDHEGYSKADYEAALAAIAEFDAVPIYPRSFARTCAEYDLSAPVPSEGGQD